MSTTRKAPAKDTYLALVRRCPLVPIKDEGHYDEAVAFLKKLAIRDEGTLDSGETAYLDALTLFVEDYRNKRHWIEARQMTPLDAVNYLMEESGMKPADLGRVLGNRSLASQILKGHRELSKANIVALAHHFHVGPGLFLPVIDHPTPTATMLLFRPGSGRCRRWNISVSRAVIFYSSRSRQSAATLRAIMSTMKPSNHIRIREAPILRDAVGGIPLRHPAPTERCWGLHRPISQWNSRILGHMASGLLDELSGYVTHVTHVAGIVGDLAASATTLDRKGSGIRSYRNGIPHKQ